MTTSSPPEDVRATVLTMKMIEVSGKVFTDQTRLFPIQSSKGNKYIMVLYNNNTNVILTKPMKYRLQNEMIRIQIVLYDYLTLLGLVPQVQSINNECPEKLKTYFQEQKINFQLVLPHLHRTNTVKCDIATFKDSFMAGTIGTSPSFPMHLWYRLIPQATTTLNLMCLSCLNPFLSAEVLRNMKFDYN